MRRRLVMLGGLALLLSAGTAQSDEEASLRDRAEAVLRRAVTYHRDKVATGGGYLWRYAADLSAREGEGVATETMVWVQPPGTPSVGMAYLAAFEATGDDFYRDAAREVALALVRGQLRSGGWDYSIEFDPEKRRRYAYCVDVENPKGRNTSTLDDDTTQAALRFLMRVDRALDFQDETIHEAAQYALARLLAVQYPNGAWPQRFSEPPDPRRYPVRKASYPESWSRTHPNEDYRDHYTLNDNTLADMIATMLEAGRIYDEPRYRAAALRGGDFLILAQMPAPQPAWAQQYNAAMQPAWARRFEPPAVTGGESQGAIRTLLNLYNSTGETKYLEPIPAALDYLRSCRLPDGQIPRFLELETNRPLYFTKDYQLTYDDSDMPTHYAFKVGERLDSLAREYQRLRSEGPEEPRSLDTVRRHRPSRDLENRVESILRAQDEQGRWVEQARLRSQEDGEPPVPVLDMRTLARNVETLASYLASTRPE